MNIALYQVIHCPLTVCRKLLLSTVTSVTKAPLSGRLAHEWCGTSDLCTSDKSNDVAMTNLQLLPGVHIFRRHDGQIQLGINPRTSLILPEAALPFISDLTERTKSTIQREQSAQNSNTTNNSLSNLLLEHGLACRTDSTFDQLKNIDYRIRDNLLRETRERFPLQQGRATTAIQIYGGGRLGTTIAVLLATSGFPHVRVIDSTKVSDSDVIPWGASRLDVGIRRDQCAALLIERAHRGAYLRQNYPDTRVAHSLAIFAPDQVADSPWFNPELTKQCMTQDVPHLVTAATSHDAWVSHVIESGKTPCLRCNYYSMCDNDSQWSDISYQLSLRQSIETAPSTLVLHLALKTIQTVDAWLSAEYCAPGWNQWTWPEYSQYFSPWDVHPMCGCSWK